MGDMPLILRQAAQMGLFSSAALVRFLSMDVRPNVTRFITRSLPPAVSSAASCGRGLIGGQPAGFWSPAAAVAPVPPAVPAGCTSHACYRCARWPALLLTATTLLTFAPADVARGGGPPDGRPCVCAEAGAGADHHCGQHPGLRGQGARPEGMPLGGGAAWGVGLEARCRHLYCRRWHHFLPLYVPARLLSSPHSCPTHPTCHASAGARRPLLERARPGGLQRALPLRRYD